MQPWMTLLQDLSSHFKPASILKLPVHLTIPFTHRNRKRDAGTTVNEGRRKKKIEQDWRTISLYIILKTLLELQRTTFFTTVAHSHKHTRSHETVSLFTERDAHRRRKSVTNINLTDQCAIHHKYSSRRRHWNKASLTTTTGHQKSRPFFFFTPIVHSGSENVLHEARTLCDTGRERAWGYIYNTFHLPRLCTEMPKCTTGLFWRETQRNKKM